MYNRVTRVIPAVRSALRSCRCACHRQHAMVPACHTHATMCRPFSWGPLWGGPGRRDPFRQMDDFMRDMERKLKETVDMTFDSFREFPRFADGSRSLRPFRYTDEMGEVTNLSSGDKYKLSSNFHNARPEDINVALKERKLTVTGKVERKDETGRLLQQVEHEYELPEGVDVNTLESHIDPHGVLTVEAVRTPPEKPTPIEIKRS